VEALNTGGKYRSCESNQNRIESLKRAPFYLSIAPGRPPRARARKRRTRKPVRSSLSP
jgi:hypothetical protein